MANPTHNLFVDDSGTKEYAEDKRYSITGGKTPYFVFGGMLLTPGEASVVTKAMRNFKLDTFGTPDVEIKANWLRIWHERKVRYLDKFEVTNDELTAFTDDVYSLLNDCDCKLVACVVNKEEVQQQYKQPHYAPAIAYDCLLQRVQQEMASYGGEAFVTIDAMDGATPRGHQYLDNLKRQHAKLKRHGSPLMGGMRFDRIGGQAFRDSKADERLQLADLVSYAVYRQFVDHGPDWENKDKKQLPVYEYFGRIASKFRNHAGRVQGYGIVKFPLNTRIHWGVKK